MGGTQVALGYIGDPSTTGAKFFNARIAGAEPERWYRSGDLVRQDSALGMVFAGRVDEQVKIGGYRIEILDVEAVLRRVSGTSECAVVAWPLSAEGVPEGLIGFVTGAGCEPRAIVKAMRQALPGYMVPAKINVLETLPLNANGKIDKRALRESLVSNRG